MDSKTTDLLSDIGLEKFASMVQKGGALSDLPRNFNISEILTKQSYAKSEDFADTVNREFSIATPLEAHISARYAEKCASADLNPTVINRLNEACHIYGVRPVEFQETKLASEDLSANDIFYDERVGIEVTKEASYIDTSSYGTEFEKCIAARSMVVPDELESLDKIASMKDSVPPVKMAALLKSFDELTGCDMPWIQDKVGTPEYAVFEKRASELNINIGGKSYAIEDLAEKTAAFESLGLDIDFDDDPYTIKLALEKLPERVQKCLTKIL